MKYKFIAIILISTVFLSFSFINIPHNDTRPPGTVKIVENFYFDETELTNIDWREYLHWLKKEYGNDSEKYIAALPDTTVWLDFDFGKTLGEQYFNHPSFNDYPIVGITLEQAKSYCIWRTDRVKEMWALNFGAENVPNLKYRLPTRLEWELVANTGFKPHSKKVNRKYKNKKPTFFFNIKGDLGSGNHYMAPSRSYLPNKHGMYNLFGNVAEMVDEEGVAKGGSWLHDYDEVMSNSDFEYDAPKAWLGFRCVAEIMD